MSTEEREIETEQQKREKNRILVTAFFFRTVLSQRLSNAYMRKSSLFSSYKFYELCRDRLKDDNLIRLHEHNRFIEITDDGVRFLISHLIEGELNGNRVHEAFLRRLGIFTLFPLKLSSEDKEALFWTLLILYNDVFVDDFRKNLLYSIKNDYQEGLVNSLNNRLSNAYMLIIEGAEEMNGSPEHALILVTRGYNLLMRFAYLVFLWGIYRYNFVALYTVVRVAAMILSGQIGSLLLVLVGIVYGILMGVLTEYFWLGMVGIILQLATFLIIPFSILALAASIPAKIAIYLYLKRSKKLEQS